MQNFIFLFCLLAGLLSPVFCVGQVEFGLKAGLSTQSLVGETYRFNRAGLDNLTLSLTEAEYGIQAGVFFRIPLGDRLFLQPEITFNSNQANFRFNNPDQNESFVFSERYNYVDVPLLLGYRLGFLRVQAGPVGHIYFAQMSDVLSREGWDAALESFNLGYALGAAIDIAKFTLDLRFDGNFGELGQTFSFGSNEVAIDQAPKRWIATLGYRF
ncbi:MAG: PorT family protein [Lewinella sp.]|nr:PorT family protein [Lewinella sp.]